MKIFAIDPGNVYSAYCIMDDEYNLLEFKKDENKIIMDILLNKLDEINEVIIERIANMGMPAGATLFETAEWIGRFSQEAEKKVPVKYIYRRDEKLYICGNSRAKDANIRAALIERFAKFDKVNGKGTSKHRDVFYGVKADCWAAISVAVTHLDMRRDNNLKENRYVEKLDRVADNN